MKTLLGKVVEYLDRDRSGHYFGLVRKVNLDRRGRLRGVTVSDPWYTERGCCWSGPRHRIAADHLKAVLFRKKLIPLVGLFGLVARAKGGRR